MMWCSRKDVMVCVTIEVSEKRLTDVLRMIETEIGRPEDLIVEEFNGFWTILMWIPLSGFNALLSQLLLAAADGLVIKCDVSRERNRP